MSKFKSKPIIRNVNDTFLIICGGDTEIIYFNLLKKKFKDKLTKIELCIVKETTSPYRIVERAIKDRDSKNGINETWVVFDKDDNTDFDSAIEYAHKNNIKCAYSNQAFELWFLNHFECIKTTMSRNKYKQELEKFFKERCSSKTTYSKRKNKVNKSIEKLLDEELIKTAINNSKIAYQFHNMDTKNFSEKESSTTVFQLIEKLLK